MAETALYLPAITDELCAYAVRQWRRRGIIASTEEAATYLAAQSPAFVASVERRMKAGFQVPRI